MVAHNVKCKVCGITFDRDVIEAVPAGGRRYAHATCAGEILEPTEEEEELATLHQYLKALFKDKYNYITLSKEIEKYKQTNGYRYSGILKSLIYWYEVKQNTLEKANGRIGIVPFIYEDAKTYYYALYQANQNNVGKNLEEYKCPKIREIRIKAPARNVATFRLFNLDD